MEFYKEEYERLSNTWTMIGIFAFKPFNESSFQIFKPYFYLTNQQKFNEINNQSYLINYLNLNPNDLIGFCRSCSCFTPTQDILQHFIDGMKIYIGGYAFLQNENDSDINLRCYMNTGKGSDSSILEAMIFHNLFVQATKEHQTPWIYPALIELTKSQLLNAAIID